MTFKDHLFQDGENAGDIAARQYNGGNIECAGFLGKGALHKTNQGDIELSLQSLQQGVDMRFGAAGVTAGN